MMHFWNSFNLKVILSVLFEGHIRFCEIIYNIFNEIGLNDTIYGEIKGINLQ